VRYELIMGERRWRASREAGQETIPAIVKSTDDDDLLRDALLEIERAAPFDRPPELGRPTDRRLAWTFAAATAAAAVLLAVLLVNAFGDDDRGIGDSSPTPVVSPSVAPSGTPEVTGTPGATATPEASASEPPASAAADLTWTETGSFGDPGGAAFVNNVAQLGDASVAIGVQYETVLPNLGPPPAHEGRVWLSADGTSWEDVTPDETFDHVVLHHSIVTADGQLIVFGFASDAADQSALPRLASWGSTDGLGWQERPSPFPDEAFLSSVRAGGRGYAAVVGDPDGLEVWWSADADAWEPVLELGDDVTFDLGAGDEGFVIGGHRAGTEGGREPFVLASGDGREWLESASPPQSISDLAPRGGDWIAIASDQTSAVPGTEATAEAWASGNGLDWSRVGAYTLRASAPEEGQDPICTEHPSGLWAAGPWLVSQATLTFPCSEGGHVVPGTSRISLDGTSWLDLPFEPGRIGQSGSGTRVSGAVEVDGRLVLVGERNRLATFWIGEVP
jgi:hypothetical protein